MNKQNENKLVMMKALLSFLKLNQAIWQNSAPFAAAVAELEELIAVIEVTRQITDLDQTGLVVEKKSLKAILVDTTFEIASQLVAMASKTGDQILLAKVNFPKSELEGQRDGGLASTSKTILTLGREKMASLVEYDITEDELSALEELIARYETSLPTSRVSVSGRKVNNAKIKDLFLNSNVLLKNQIKRIMTRYATSNPDFYAGYLNASKVVDYGTRYEKKKDPGNTQ
jgi:hypothetical protein